MVSQEQFINKILATGDYSLISENNLTREYFFNYPAEFDFILNHFEKYHKVPDTATFSNAFPDFKIVKCDEPVNYLLENLQKDYNTAYLAERFNKIKSMLENGKTDEAVNYFKNSVDNLHVGGASHCTDLITDHSRYDAFLARSANRKNAFISTGFPELDSIIGGIDKSEEDMVIAARTGIGKCLAKGTKVLMADGTIKAVENVRVGDKVQSFNRINTVLALHNGISKGYKIIPNKGEPFVVSENHILTLFKYNESWDRQSKKVITSAKDGKLVDITVEDFLDLSAHQKHLYKLFRPAIDYESKAQLIDPYILGVWLGDGYSRDGYICTADKEIKESLADYCLNAKAELKHIVSQDETNCKTYSLGSSFRKALQEYNLLDNKHIPLNYLTGDYNQRVALLAGLLDTDGCYMKGSSLFDFTNKNKLLFDQVAQLARGLGFKVSIGKPKNTKNNLYYRMVISGGLSNLCEIPTKVARKKATYSNRHVSTNVGFKVEPVDRVEYYGFMCDGDSRYLLADNTLTHNTWVLCKIAAAASKQGICVGLYSGEMSADKVGYRIDTLLSEGIANSSITRGDMDPMMQMQYKRYLDSLPNQGYGAIKVLTPNDIAGPATVAALDAFVVREHIQLLLVDQYSLLEDTSRSTVMHERVANISKAIKNLQVMRKIPVVSVSQMNRTKNEDNEQDTTQIGLSDRIGQDATTIIMLSRNNPSPDGDYSQEQLILNIVKARDGGDGKKLTYKADFNHGQFTYIDVAANKEEAKKLRDEYEDEDE